MIEQKNEDGGKRRNAAKKRSWKSAEKRIAELSAIFKRLYEDSVTGRISDERFTELSADYEAEQRELKERAAAIQAELSKAQEATVNAEKFMKVSAGGIPALKNLPLLCCWKFERKSLCMSAAMTRTRPADRILRLLFILLFSKVDLPK